MLSPLEHNRLLTTECLREYRNRRVLFFPNPGNAGDSLICLGTMHLLDRLGVRWEPVGAQGNVQGQTVLIGGGGNLVPLYRDTRVAMERFATAAARLIVLPHTIRGNEDLLRSLGPTATVFCRDVESYAHVLRNTAPGVEVVLAHDMAFHVEADRFLRSHPQADRFRARFAERLGEAGVDLASDAVRRRARFGRGDEESAGHVANPHLDVSAVFAFGTWPHAAELSAWCLLEALRIVESVETDRLHVAIGCALLGRECTLHDNSYGKNRVVYDHSLRRFPSVTFADKTRAQQGAGPGSAG
ncbi:MAG: polysaccharide pyruvyl transferase family protein [Acetobacteraceae bacterium]|mgnify:CR=1 FL=1|nr:polysaccharide pyruvyl transferase family protein [Acetobacteraceae bacterium]